MQWYVTGMSTEDKYGYKNCVIIASYKVITTEGDLVGQAAGAVVLQPPEGEFTPYDKITQDQALKWTQTALGEERVTATENEAQADLDQQKIPQPEPRPLPWSPQEETP